MNPRHRWVQASHRNERERLVASLDVPPVLAGIDAHRQLRGPYTFARTLLPMLTADAIRLCPDVVMRHDIEILTTTPELSGNIKGRQTLTSLAAPKERTRYYSRLRTLRVAHGLAEFMREYMMCRQDGPWSLIVENVHAADDTDRELLAVMLRRVDPSIVTLVICTEAELPDDPPGPVAAPLAPALATYTSATVGHSKASPAPVRVHTKADLARQYVEAHGVTDDPALLTAYENLTSAERAALHDEQLSSLRTGTSRAFDLGALCWHAERGSERSVALEILSTAAVQCLLMGFYHATSELAERGRRLTAPEEDYKTWRYFTIAFNNAMAALGRAEAAQRGYHEMRAFSQDPQIHANAAYAEAMLYTRHFDADRRDHMVARALLNTAISIADLLPDPEQRAFESAFQRNGLALVAIHQGRPEEALELVEDAISRLDSQLRPNEHALHRSVLRVNRAQVLATLGQLEDSLADYTAVIELDPNYAEYYFERANLLRRMGRTDGALADYDRALGLSPPFPEVYYNRGDLRAELGDIDGAIADFSYVIELDPDNVDAYANRAGLRCDAGDSEGAWTDVDAGLVIDSDHAHLLCLKGRLLVDSERFTEAIDTLSVAIAKDDRLAEAWACRGAVASQLGDGVAALADLDRAIALADIPAFRFNRAVVRQQCGRYAEAVADYDAVMAATADPEAGLQRMRCIEQLQVASQAGGHPGG